MHVLRDALEHRRGKLSALMQPDRGIQNNSDRNGWNPLQNQQPPPAALNKGNQQAEIADKATPGNVLRAKRLMNAVIPDCGESRTLFQTKDS